MQTDREGIPFLVVCTMAEEREGYYGLSSCQTWVYCCYSKRKENSCASFEGFEEFMKMAVRNAKDWGIHNDSF